jgi:hypothetical protein
MERGCLTGKSDVSRSHILGGERVAEQRLVGEVAPGSNEHRLIDKENRVYY